MYESLPKLALDEIFVEDKSAKNITKIIKKSGKVIGYEIANEFDVSVEDAILLARAGKIKNVGIAHNKETIYLKSIPDGTEDNNLSSLPTKNI